MVKSWCMSKFTKLSVLVPGVVRKRFVALDHGYKQLACTGGLIWYFNADEETQEIYRLWARDIAEGKATIEAPSKFVATALAKLAEEKKESPPPRRKKRGK